MRTGTASLVALAGIALASLALTSACSKDAPSPTSGATVPAATGLPDRDPALARKLVSEGAVLLDVRTPGEFAGGHLDGAINIPVDELQSRMADVDKLTGGDPKKPIVVYCQAGSRAGRAKATLLGAGHPQVTNLGGIGDWDRK